MVDFSYENESGIVTSQYRGVLEHSFLATIGIIFVGDKLWYQAIEASVASE
jgi:hypothetical protein